MNPAEIRCTAPHPKVPGWECRAKLTEIYPGSVSLARRNGHPPKPGCVTLRCERCGTEYEACPVSGS